MIKAIKVRLNPNNKQLTKLFQYAGCARFAYNWAISREEENHKQGNKFFSSFFVVKNRKIFYNNPCKTILNKTYKV